jgi:hypothetical protein
MSLQTTPSHITSEQSVPPEDVLQASIGVRTRTKASTIIAACSALLLAGTAYGLLTGRRDDRRAPPQGEEDIFFVL